MTLRCRPLYSQLKTSQVLLAQRLLSNDCAGSWIMPRLPVNIPRWDRHDITERRDSVL